MDKGGVTDYRNSLALVLALSCLVESVQTAEYYVIDCMYRGYAVAKKEGSVDIVVYFDCGSDLFGEDISIYELTAYHSYEKGTKATDDTFLDVIEKAGYTIPTKGEWE